MYSLFLKISFQQGIIFCFQVSHDCGQVIKKLLSFKSKHEVHMIVYKKLEPPDIDIFKKLIQLFDEMFENKDPATMDEINRKTLLRKNDFISLVAMDDHEVIGGVTAYELLLYSGQTEVYIYDIAVKTAFQKKGIGTKLINALHDHCKQKGIKTMFVEAHEEDKHAVNFYYKAGGQAEKVVHFNFNINLTGNIQ
jgi:aminoglycoside 3-N-acetyltransferase I